MAKVKLVTKCVFCRKSMFVGIGIECCLSCENIFDRLVIGIECEGITPKWSSYYLGKVSRVTFNRIVKAVKLYEVEKALDGI